MPPGKADALIKSWPCGDGSSPGRAMCDIGAPIAATNLPLGGFLDYISGRSVIAGSAVRPEGVRPALFLLLPRW